MTKSLGQIAFEAYELHYSNGFGSLEPIKWNAVTDRERQKWELAASAVLNAVCGGVHKLIHDEDATTLDLEGILGSACGAPFQDEDWNEVDFQADWNEVDENSR